MSEAEKVKKDWFNILKAIGNVLELEDSIDKSEMFDMLLRNKWKIEKEVSKYYEIVQLTTFRLEPLNQPTNVTKNHPKKN
jgi:hypothetical protein